MLEFDLLALELDSAIFGDGAGRALSAERFEFGPGVHPHRHPCGAHVVQPFHRAFLGQLSLTHRGGLLDLRRGGGVALGGVGHGLLGGFVGAGQVEHLAAEPFDEAARIGLGVGERCGGAPARGLLR